MKIGFLGPIGTFSYEACKKYYHNYENIPFKNITETIKALNNNIIDECIVPIENSIQGSVTETIDTLIDNPNIYIVSEKTLAIKQHLMSKTTYSFSEIKEVYSHPQALAQCRKFLTTNLPNAKLYEVSSTALAAKEITSIDFAACIANISCLEQYNLTLLKDNIQDNNMNTTRFWVLSKSLNSIKNSQKISIVFSTEHKPGALYSVLKIFNDYKINLTKIESRPAKTILGEYNFWIDLELTNNIEKALNTLKSKVTYYRILGNY